MLAYAKAIVAFAGVLVALVDTALVDGVFTSTDIENLIVGAVTAVFVYFVRNQPQPTPPPA